MARHPSNYLRNRRRLEKPVKKKPTASIPLSSNQVRLTRRERELNQQQKEKGNA